MYAISLTEDNHPSLTSADQLTTELVCHNIYTNFFPITSTITTSKSSTDDSNNEAKEPTTMETTTMDGHAIIAARQFVDEWVMQPSRITLRTELLTKALRSFIDSSTISKSYLLFDASRPWLVYWTIHALDLLHIHEPDDKSSLLNDVTTDRIVTLLKECQDSNGGFGGGPGQLPNVVTSYSAVLGLCIVGTTKALELIDRSKMYRYLMSSRVEVETDSGQRRFEGFLLYEDGEIDVRGVYCAIAVASILQIITPELTEGVAQFIKRLQRWDGGIAGYVDGESHGGYTYCALACLCIIGDTAPFKDGGLDINRLLNWCMHRQMGMEGGYNGRPNKLVDSCYSFWIGASLRLIDCCIALIDNSDTATANLNNVTSDTDALKLYVLACCQDMDRNKNVSAVDDEAADDDSCNDSDDEGGMLLKDKPGKDGDLYHTCYGLCGLSVTAPYADERGDRGELYDRMTEAVKLNKTHIMYNITFHRLAFARKYFAATRLSLGSSSYIGSEGIGVLPYEQIVNSTLTTHSVKRIK